MGKIAKSKPKQKVAEKFVLDHEVYASVSMAANLEAIRLTKSDFEIKPEVFEVLEDLQNMGHGFHGRTSDLQYDEEAGLAMGYYQWNAEIKSGRKKVLKLTARYFIVYSDLEHFDEGHVKFFFSKVVRFATYPYFRALFSRQCAESGVMLPPLPTLSERVD